MTRIIKIRTIPRGYVKVEEKYLQDRVNEIMAGHTVSGLFMMLFNKLGKPQDGGLWSYMLRHNNVVMKITATDKDTLAYDVWLSPGYIQEAKRKRTKVINVIARRLNDNDVVFAPEEDITLYYPIRTKNSAIQRKYGLSEGEIKAKMDKTLTDEEKTALYGGLTQYIENIFDEIRYIINEIGR